MYRLLANFNSFVLTGGVSPCLHRKIRPCGRNAPLAPCSSVVRAAFNDAFTESTIPEKKEVTSPSWGNGVVWPAATTHTECYTSTLTAL